jgi:hypothetical protein
MMTDMQPKPSSREDQRATIRQAGAGEGDLVGRLAHALLAELYPDYARDFGEAGFIAKAHRALAHGDRFWAFIGEHQGRAMKA